MKILITGGTGFIGSALSDYFSKQGSEIYILTRSLHGRGQTNPQIKLITGLDYQEEYDVIINLAGEPLNKKRWNAAVKKNIYASRIKTTAKLLDYIKNCTVKPQLLISGSAIGFYGNSADNTFTEDSPPADNDFTHTLCNDWEQTALQAKQYGVRVCLLRTGIVLGKNGGVLKQMVLPFKLGLGAKLGDGRQWMSWIHIKDMVAAVDFLITNIQLSGPFNFTSPGAVTNQEFTRQLAKALHRPTFLTLPGFMVGIMFGEMGKTLLLGGQRVVPDKLLAAGYQFKFPQLAAALGDILSGVGDVTKKT